MVDGKVHVTLGVARGLAVEGLGCFYDRYGAGLRVVCSARRVVEYKGSIIFFVNSLLKTRVGQAEPSLQRCTNIVMSPAAQLPPQLFFNFFYILQD